MKISIVATVILGLFLGWNIGQADSPAGFALGIQSAGTPVGAVVAMNFSTGTSVALSGGVATVTALVLPTA